VWVSRCRRAILAHPDVVECAVVAVPDELVTNRLKAVVVTSRAVAAADVLAACAERLPRYMVPTEIELVPGLPRTSTGKLDRAALARPGDPPAT
jgi:L-proline---[L-prolyl-carrier protein] ligase